MTESSFAINHFFTGKIDVLWVNGPAGEYTRMICLGRDAGGILLQHEGSHDATYYPWHRIEEIDPVTVRPS